MLSPQALLRGIISRALPPPQPDNLNQDAPLVLDSYGKIVSPMYTKHGLVAEGCYFTATLAPSATPLAYGVQATFADIAGFFAIQNNDFPVGSGGTGRIVYPDFLRFVYSVAPASGTSALLAIKVDAITRQPSANFALAGTPAIANGPTNVNGASPLKSVVSVYFPTGGTITLPAATGAARLIEGNLQLRTQIPLIGDEVDVLFGPTDFTQMSSNAAAVLATLCKQQIATQGFGIGPQQIGLFHLWFPSNTTTAASFSNIHVGWFER